MAFHLIKNKLIKRMINQLKFRLRRSLGLVDVQERVEHLARQNQEIQNYNRLLESQLKDTLDYNQRIFNQVEQLLDQQKKQFLRDVIQESKPGSLLNCCINNCDILAPVELLKLYSHCLEPNENKKLTYRVETHCIDWLASQLNSGDTILDIGASLGTISLPLAKIVGETGHIYAFEPARKTQQCLQKILDINQINNISVIKSAISEQPGMAQFIEYVDTNSFSWVADTSTLSISTIETNLEHLTYDVNVTTIDDFVFTHNLQPKAIKIDIEGFELYALHGGKSTLKNEAPYLCIDIHQDVKTGKSALLGVEPFLNSLGYQMELKKHTLFCTPTHRH